MRTQKIVFQYLLKVAKDLGVGKTWENGKVRIHRFARLFRVWDLTNAGKRGKKVRRMDIHPITRDAEDWVEEQSRYIILNAARGYDSIKDYFSSISVENAWPTHEEGMPLEVYIDIKEYQDRGVDVLPGTTQPIKLEWRVDKNLMTLESSPLDFSVKSCVIIGEAHYSQDTLYWPKNRTAAKRFYSWLSGEGEGAVQRMTIQDLRKLWDSIDVDYDYH